VPHGEYQALRAEWEKRQQSAPPDRLERLLSGNADVAEELLKDSAEGHRSRSWWARLHAWMRR
jgi:hypothetical protein